MRDGTKKVREALAGIEAPGLTMPAISALIGGKATVSVASMVKAGELTMVGEGRKHTYYLNPEFTEPPANKPERKTMKDIARKHVDKPKPATLPELALENLLAAGEQLRVTIRNQVEGVEDDEILTAALTAHERAEKLLSAATA